MTHEPEALVEPRDRWFEAVHWHDRLEETGESELSGLEFQQWQTWVADEDNRRVFDQMTRLMGDGPRCRPRALPGREALDADPYDASEPLRLPSKSGHERPPAQRTAIRTSRLIRGLKLVALAASVTVATTVALVLHGSRTSPQGVSSNESGQMYRALPGTVRNVTLGDGSTLTLGAQSAVSVRFTADRRLLTLENGEAWFKVAPDAQRPFTVTVGPHSITALGTAFVVRRSDERVVVTVLEGNVEVASQSPPASGKAEPSLTPTAATARLAIGEQIIFDQAGSASLFEHTKPEAVTGWSTGRLDFDGQTLKDVAEVLSRYWKRTLCVDGPSGAQRFTGVVRQGEIDEFVRRLADIYPVELTEQDGSVCVRSRLSASSTTRSEDCCPPAKDTTAQTHASD